MINLAMKIWIKGNECVFDIKLHSLLTYLILPVKTKLVYFDSIISDYN